MSFTVGSITHCLISYYSAADAPEQGKLQRPSKDPELIDLKIRQELLEQYCRIPFSKHGRHDKDWYSLKSNDGMPALDPMGDAGMLAPSSYNPMDEDWYSLKSSDGMPALDPMGNAGMLAPSSYDPMDDTDVPALGPYNPIGDTGVPALDYDMMTGNGEDQDFKVPSRFSQPPDPNSEFMEASNQQGPPPTTHPFT